MILLACVSCMQGGRANTGPIDLTYTGTRVETYGADSKGKHEKVTTTRIICDGLRIYATEESRVRGIDSPIFRREYLYDGKLVYLVTSLGAATIYGDEGLSHGRNSRFFYSWYFWALGLDLPDSRLEVGEGIRNLCAQVARSSTEKSAAAGPIRMIAVRDSPDAVYRYWVLTIGGTLLVLQSELWQEHKLRARCKNADFLWRSGMWFARDVRCEQFADNSSGPVAVERIVLKSIVEDASLLPTRPELLVPGTRVRDARYRLAPTARDGFFVYDEHAQIHDLEKQWDEAWKNDGTRRRLATSAFGLAAGAALYLLIVWARTASRG